MTWRLPETLCTAYNGVTGTVCNSSSMQHWYSCTPMTRRLAWCADAHAGAISRGELPAGGQQRSARVRPCDSCFGAFVLICVPQLSFLTVQTRAPLTTCVRVPQEVCNCWVRASMSQRRRRRGRAAAVRGRAAVLNLRVHRGRV